MDLLIEDIFSSARMLARMKIRLMMVAVVTGADRRKRVPSLGPVMKTCFMFCMVCSEVVEKILLNDFGMSEFPSVVGMDSMILGFQCAGEVLLW